MGAQSRRKGADGERELAGVLRDLGFVGARRGQQFKGTPDSPDVAGIPGLHVECKRTETLSLYEALAQSIDEAGGEVPVVIHRRSHRPWLVIVQLTDFDAAARAWLAAREKQTEVA